MEEITSRESKEILDDGILISPKTLNSEPSKPVVEPIVKIPKKTEEKPEKKTLYIILTLVVLVLIGLGVLYWSISSNRTGQEDIQTKPVVEKDVLVPRTLSYKNDKYGFQFDFPGVFAIPPSTTYESGSLLFSQNLHFSAFGRDAFGGVVSVLVASTDNTDLYLSNYLEEVQVTETEASLGPVSKKFSSRRNSVDSDGVLIEEVTIFSVGDTFVEIKYLVDDQVDESTYKTQHDVYLQIVKSFRILTPEVVTDQPEDVVADE